MKEYLDSNRVNFLIWRYLIEGNYRETAVKFQKEWHIQDPHRQLDFAPHVKSHALVDVLNKGLRFHSLEREYAQATQVPGAGGAAVTQAALAEAMQLGVFGPLVAHPAPHQQQSDENDMDADAEPDTDFMVPAPIPTVPTTTAPTAILSAGELENSRKRQVDKQQLPLVNGSPAKRPRLNNGYSENGVDAATTPMDVDAQEDNHAYPSPLEGDQAPTPLPRTDGPEQGTQVDKVEELATETTFIPLGSSLDDAPFSSPATALSRINGDNAPVLLHCQWHPQDPSLLAAAGTDALARIWNVSHGATADPTPDDHVNGFVPDFHTLVDDDVPPKASITAMAWNWNGSAIAVATDSDAKARLALWSPDGTPIHHFEVAESPIIKLKWNPGRTSSAILAIAPDNGGTLITIYNADTLNSFTYYLPQHDLHAEPLDAAWTSDTDFLLCGGELMVLLKCADGEVTEVQKFQTREGDNLIQVLFDIHSSYAATCSEKGFVDIWDNTGRKREIEAHCDAVTALAWQPLEGAMMGNERLIASGGEDGAIMIWNARADEGKAVYSMNMGPAIVALAFTPDGAFLAGATSEKILIWKVGEHSVPRASWSRLPHPGWLSPSPRMNMDSDEEDEHCLGWDSTGHKLAYGVNSRLAVINFR